MKFLSKSVFVLLAGVLIFSSCKEKTSPQLSAIPSDATFVVTFEIQKMIQKGGLNNLSEYKSFAKVKERMTDMDPALQKLLDEFIKDPKSSGLDFEKTYIYGSKGSNTFYCSANFEMDNKTTFEKKITELFKSQDEGMPEIKDMGSCKIVSENGVALVWNDDLLQIFGGDIDGLDYKSLFDLPIDKSILSVTDFVSFQKEPCDIGFWMSYGELMNFVGKMDITMPEYVNEFKDAYVHGSLNFESGEIKAAAHISPQSKVDEFFKKYPVIKKDFNTALLEDFPDKSYLLAKLSINWVEYIKLLNESVAQMQAPGMDIYQELFNDPTVKTLFDIIEGDVVFSLYNLAQGPLPIPLAGLSFTLKNEGDFERFLALFPKDMLKENGGYYVIATPFMVGLNIGYKDKRVLITDDAEAIASFISKGFSPNLKNNPMAVELKKSPALFYLNLDLETYPENLRAMLKNNIPGEVRIFLSTIEPLKDMSYSVNEKNEAVFSLKFKDSKQNSLKTILKTVDDAASRQ